MEALCFRCSSASARAVTSLQAITFKASHLGLSHPSKLLRVSSLLSGWHPSLQKDAMAAP